MSPRLLLVSIACGLGCLGALGAPGDAPATPPALTPALAPFLDTHCLECHDRDAKKGGLDLESLPYQSNQPAAHALWVRIYDRVAAGEMPPKKKSRPAATELTAFLQTLGTDLAAEHATQKNLTLRRLSREEYENTLSTLLGIPLHIQELLPPDPIQRGFDHLAAHQTISSVQLERYLQAATTAIDAALCAPEAPPTRQLSVPVTAGHNKNGPVHHALPDGANVVFHDGKYPAINTSWRAPLDGRYRLRQSAAAYQTTAILNYGLFTDPAARGHESRLLTYADAPPRAPFTTDITVDLKAGEGLRYFPLLAKPTDRRPSSPDKNPNPGIAFYPLAIEGPLFDTWPSRGHTLLFGDLPVHALAPKNPQAGKKSRALAPSSELEVRSRHPADDARRLLPGFLTAAYRRPTTADELAPFLHLFDQEMKNGATFHHAIRTAATAILCSPGFLYLDEKPGPLSQYALASRLAYFLTRSPPDATLLDLAAHQQLTTPSVLSEQTERLLRSPAATRFTHAFTDAWLNLREINATSPDQKLYPEYDPLLQDSILRETRAFFTEILRRNLPLTTFLQSDFAMLNSRLARHYGIPGVAGLHLRPVPITPDSHRGGLLTQASILKVTANGTNTSPVMRGAWVLDRIYGTPSPPPPPGITGVEPDSRGATTLRQLLEKHRTLESCNSCHRQIDPPGFALENYDVIGGWRTHFRIQTKGSRTRLESGPSVDASGQTPDGRPFRNYQEFQKLLLSANPQFTRNLTEQLLTFATARAPGFSDRPEIERLTQTSLQQGNGFRALIHLVVQSPLFLSP